MRYVSQKSTKTYSANLIGPRRSSERHRQFWLDQENPVWFLRCMYFTVLQENQKTRKIKGAKLFQCVNRRIYYSVAITIFTTHHELRYKSREQSQDRELVLWPFNTNFLCVCGCSDGFPHGLPHRTTLPLKIKHCDRKERCHRGRYYFLSKILQCNIPTWYRMAHFIYALICLTYRFHSNSWKCFCPTVSESGFSHRFPRTRVFTPVSEARTKALTPVSRKIFILETSRIFTVFYDSFEL